MPGDSGPAPTARFAARGDGDRGYSPTARGRTGARRRAAPGRLGDYLEDRFLRRLWTRIREAGPIRSISLDLTERCNLRCAGCYFFAEGMERSVPPDEAEFDAFVERERARGTNLVTVVGGEPSLALERLEKLHRAFRVNVATNGLQPIPRAGFEEMPIGISVWGAPHTDRELRGAGRVDVFRRALANYPDDPRAFWYYTVAPGHARQVAPVVERCVANGNRVLFNFYSDVAGLGGDLDPRRGFADVRRAIDAAIERHPDRILMPSYLSRVVSTGRLRGRRWGHDVCTSVTFDHPANRARVENGRPYSPHFRAYNADLSTRRCCTGIDRSCAACFDTWQHFSWVLLDLRAHLRSRQAFADWLTTTYLFYLTNRLVDFDEGARLLPEIHARGGLDRTAAPAPQRQAPVAAHPRL